MTEVLGPLSIIVPSYNESGHIARLLERIARELGAAGLAYDVAVVDDDSPDGTAAVVEGVARADPRVRLHRRTSDRGLASAVAYGIRNARAPIVVVMDADFNHDPADIARLRERLRSCDVACGSRFVAGGGMRSKWRNAASYLFNLFIRLALRTDVRDNLSGFFAARRELLARIDEASVFYGYGDYYIRLLALARRSGWSVCEIPVRYGTRPSGTSKTQLLGTTALYVRSVLALRFGRARPRLRPSDR